MKRFFYTEGENKIQKVIKPKKECIYVSPTYPSRSLRLPKNLFKK